MSHFNTSDIELVVKCDGDLQALKRRYGYLVSEMDGIIAAMKTFIVENNSEIAEQNLDPYLTMRLRESRGWFRSHIDAENATLRKNMEKIEGMFEAESWGVEG